MAAAPHLELPGSQPTDALAAGDKKLCCQHHFSFSNPVRNHSLFSRLEKMPQAFPLEKGRKPDETLYKPCSGGPGQEILERILRVVYGPFSVFLYGSHAGILFPCG